MLKIYHDEVPEFLREASLTDEMARLRKVGMDCGCEYTSLSWWRNVGPYKRYEHSLGVALIVWHFTGSQKAALAGLFHDISTPAFAHVVDFMNNDHVSQESTEEGTREIIENSEGIRKILDELGLTVDDVCDYHIYSIADNDSPLLSADRLEYTLNNMVRYQGYSKKEVKAMYDDLTVGINEYAQQELMFQHEDIAEAFVHGCLKNSRLYICDEDRYSMERLALILRDKIKEGVIAYEDLYIDEEVIINKIGYSPEWQDFRAMTEVNRSDVYLGEGWLQIEAKKRYIDPMVIGRGRISSLRPSAKQDIDDFLRLRFDYYLKGE